MTGHGATPLKVGFQVATSLPAIQGFAIASAWPGRFGVILVADPGEYAVI
jgi:hypothetical protein